MNRKKNLKNNMIKTFDLVEEMSSGLSCSTTYDVDHLGDNFKVEFQDINYAFDYIENFLIPIEYDPKNPKHFDLSSNIVNAKFTFVKNGKEIIIPIVVNGIHKRNMCSCGMCWWGVQIKRPKEITLDIKRITFSFSLLNIENIRFMESSLFDSKQKIQIFATSNYIG